MPISFPFRIDATGRTVQPSDAAAWVRELLELVLFTAPGERVMRPTFGSGTHQLVFAPASDEVATATQHLVRSALQQWLSDWIEVQDVTVVGEENRLTATVIFLLRSTREQQRASFTREA